MWQRSLPQHRRCGEAVDCILLTHSRVARKCADRRRCLAASCPAACNCGAAPQHRQRGRPNTPCETSHTSKKEGPPSWQKSFHSRVLPHQQEESPGCREADADGAESHVEPFGIKGYGGAFPVWGLQDQPTASDVEGHFIRSAGRPRPMQGEQCTSDKPHASSEQHSRSECNPQQAMQPEKPAFRKSQSLCGLGRLLPGSSRIVPQPPASRGGCTATGNEFTDQVASDNAIGTTRCSGPLDLEAGIMRPGG